MIGTLNKVPVDTLYVTSWNSNDKKRKKYASLVYDTLCDTLIGDALRWNHVAVI
jgi:hypothetical protein